MPRLVIKKGSGVGRDHALGGGECVVGRDASAQFVLDDHLASRRHFRVVQEAGAYYVEDMGSTNGTAVNGRRTQRLRLTDGDVIAAGGTKLTFVQKDVFGTASPRSAKAVKPRAVRPPDTSGDGDSGAQSQAEKPAAPLVRRRRKHLK